MIDEETYNQYMNEISELMNKDELTEREGNWLEEMSREVCYYEEFHWPMDRPTQEELEEFRRDQEKTMTTNKIEVTITKEVQERLKNIDVDKEILTAIKNVIGEDVTVDINISDTK